MARTACTGKKLMDTRKNLFEDQGITENEVRALNEFLNSFGKDYDIQNLEWASDLLENSFELELKDKVNEKMFTVPKTDQGGPLVYYYAMDIIMSTSEDSIRAMISRITRMTINRIEGENISKAVSQLRSAILRLKTAGKTPSDIIDKLLDIFQTSSVQEFNELFKGMKLKILLDGTKYEEDDILKEAEMAYLELLEKDKWLGIKSQASTFLGTTARSYDLSKFWNCNGINHIAMECTRPRNTMVFNCNKRLFYEEKGGGGTSEKSAKRPKEVKSSQMWCKRPNANGCEEKTKDGKLYHWCGQCKHWNLTHTTAQNQSKEQRKASEVEIIENKNTNALKGASRYTYHRDSNSPDPTARYAVIFQRNVSGYAVMDVEAGVEEVL